VNNGSFKNQLQPLLAHVAVRHSSINKGEAYLSVWLKTSTLPQSFPFIVSNILLLWTTLVKKWFIHVYIMKVQLPPTSSRYSIIWGL